MKYTVGKVAETAHISIRTLHHYDKIGLLHPSDRSPSGYRLYTDSDLSRLQQILFYKEIDLSLEQINELMNAKTFDPADALQDQRVKVTEKIGRLNAVLELIERTLISHEGGFSMDEKEMFEVFGDFDPAAYEQEAKERWGNSDIYQESSRRTKGYRKEDWQKIKLESAAIEAEIASLMKDRISFDDPRVIDAVERHRLHIDTWFYPCSQAMHAELGKMYTTDPRFAATYEKVAPGLAQYLSDAIQACLAHQ